MSGQPPAAVASLAAEPAAGASSLAAESPTAEADPYDRLADLADEEVRLAESGDLDALADLQARRAARIATLPRQAPPAARAALERAATAQRRAAALLATAHAEVAAELRHLSRGRAAARSYAPATAPPTPALDRPA